jgi:hypothetical protein
VKTASILFFACVFSLKLSAATITGFGNTDFTVEGFSTFSTITPGASSVTVAGTTTQSLSGSFLPVNITGSALELSLNARVIGANPGDLITITLFDDEFESQSYQANLSLFGNSGFTAVSIPVLGILNDQLNLTSIGGLTISFGGNDAISMEFDTLQSIPEPSTYALLGLGGLAFWALRRRMGAKV